MASAVLQTRLKKKLAVLLIISLVSTVLLLMAFSWNDLGVFRCAAKTVVWLLFVSGIGSLGMPHVLGYDHA